MTSKIRTQARDAVIAAEQWAATVEMERDVAQAECAELRDRIARDRVLPVIPYKGPHDTDASMLLHAADRIQRTQPFGSNLTAAVVKLIRDAVIRSQR